MPSYNGILEVDNKRGVIYFHLTDTSDMMKLEAATLLRICNLPTPIPERSLDITHMIGCDWSSR